MTETVTKEQIDAYKKIRLQEAAAHLRTSIEHIKQEWDCDVVAVPFFHPDGRTGADIQLIAQ